jgi:glycosyltransferase involved in cell wall biosynthesis
MLVSIVVATYNAEDHIEAFLESFRKHQNKHCELIIVDGKSSDRTVELITKNIDIVNRLISEPDNGIYDAWNKGIMLSSGEWIMFLGADDRLCEDAIEEYKNLLDTYTLGDIDYVSAKVHMIDSQNQKLDVVGDKWRWPKFKYKMTVAHSGSLHSRKFFEKYGFFNSDFKIVGDYELLLRAGGNLQYLFLDKVVVFMMVGGVSDTWKAIKEYIYLTSSYNNGIWLVSAYYGIEMYTKSKIRKVIRFLKIKR